MVAPEDLPSEHQLAYNTSMTEPGKLADQLHEYENACAMLEE